MCKLYKKNKALYNVIVLVLAFMTIIATMIRLLDFNKNQIEKINASKNIIERYILQLKFSVGENSILHLFLFIAIVYFYYILLRRKYEKRMRILSFVISGLIGFSNVLGYVFYKENSWDAIFSTKIGMFRGLLCAIGIWIAFYVLILCLCEIVIPSISNYNMNGNKFKYLEGDWKTVLFVFVVLLIAWLPYYFILYPGALTVDGKDQIAQVLNDYENCGTAKRLGLVNEKVILNTHHPIAYTLYIGIFVKFGQLINNMNLGIGLFTLSQALLSAFIIALSVYFMVKLKFSKIVVIGTIAFFSLWPMNPLYAVTITKDYLFALMSLLSMIVVYILIKKPHLYRNKKFMIFAILCLLGMQLTKSNGKYMILFMLVLVIIGVKQYKWHLVSTLVIPLAIYSILIAKIIFPAFDITSEGTKMAILYMPSQQVARCLVEHPDKITEEEKEAISKVFKCDGDMTVLASRYNPTRNSPIIAKYNAKASKEEIISFFKCWLGMIKKYPGTCIAATANLNYRLLYFDSVGNAYYTNITENPYGIIESNEGLRAILSKTVDTLMKMPIVSVFFYIGLYSWIIIISIGFFIAKKQYVEIIPIGFCIANILLNIIGPLMQIRYALQWVICVPFIVGMVVKVVNVTKAEKVIKTDKAIKAEKVINTERKRLFKVEKEGNGVFSKNDTLAIKGIAIIIMLYHHCFMSIDRFSKYEISFWPLPENIAVALAYFGKICVGIFVFLSAYGITTSIKSKYKNYNFNKEDIVQFTFNRYLSLISGFIFDFFIAILLCLVFRRELLLIYTQGLKGIFTFFMDMFGLAYMFKLDTLIGTWWYMGVAIVLIFSILLLIKLYHKYGFLSIVLSILLPRIMNWDVNNFTRYLLCIMLGIWFADKGKLMKIKNLALYRNEYLNKCFKLVIGFIVIAFCILFRHMENAKDYFDIFDSVIPVFIICFCNEFIIDIPIIRNALIYVGRHSMNIFLLHTLLRVKLLMDHIYSFKSAWLVVAVLLLESLILSIIVEWIKKVLNYNKLIDIIKNCFNQSEESKKVIT